MVDLGRTLLATEIASACGPTFMSDNEARCNYVILIGHQQTGRPAVNARLHADWLLLVWCHIGLCGARLAADDLRND